MPDSSDVRYDPVSDDHANGRVTTSGPRGETDFAISREAFSFDDEDSDGDDHEQRQMASGDVEDGVSMEVLRKLPSNIDESDYYSLLGLPRDPSPTEAQLTAAYHQLSLSLHPDKHAQGSREAAALHYGRVQKAYHTLIDHERKVVYDLLGEDGVRTEWDRGGTMYGGPGQRLDVGPRTMNPEEFRAWFIGQMKRREREILSSLVEPRGSITVGLDATSMFSQDEIHGYKVQFPVIRSTIYMLRYHFKTPLPQSPALWNTTPPPADGEPINVSSTGPSFDPSPEDGQLSFNASFGGPTKNHYKNVDIVDEETGGKETRKVMLPLSIFTRSFSLGTTAYWTISAPTTRQGERSSRFSSLLDGSLIEIGGLMLPQPMLHAAISRSISPLKGTRPVSLRLQATQYDLLMRCPPVLAATMTRQIGERTYASCSWKVGGAFWPLSLRQMLQPVFTLGPAKDSLYQMQGGQSEFSLSFSTIASYAPQTTTNGPEGDAEETATAKVSPSNTLSGASWGLEIDASPNGGNLSLTYGRNVFRGIIEPLVRSEWFSEGKSSARSSSVPADETRAVRLDVHSSISLDGSLGWMIRGSRKFGHFTRMGLSLGVQGSHGLVFGITWSRLGQSFNIPVALCPNEFLNLDIIALAVAVPWVSYAAVEYGLIRPRARRRRREAMGQRRKDLAKLLARRKAESKQAIDLMAEQVIRRQSRERGKNGLVILHAEYGYPGTPQRTVGQKTGHKDENQTIDVTIPVAALIQQGQLNVSRGVNRTRIIGFYDPAPLKEKKLRIRYLFAGKEHLVEADDNEDIVCPKRSHELSTVDTPD